MKEDSVYLTFDQDWADDRCVRHVLALLREHGCRATLFVTHASPVLEELHADETIELGVHPNFLPLLQGDATANAEQIIDTCRAVVPGATSARAHGLIHGTRLSRLYVEAGWRVDSNHYVPFESVAELRPWHSWTGASVVPFMWSDYMDVLQRDGAQPEALLDRADVPRVVAFHPIHVFLNCRSLEEYERAKAAGTLPSEPVEAKDGAGGGVRDVLLKVLEGIEKRGLRTGTLREFADI